MAEWVATGIAGSALIVSMGAVWYARKSANEAAKLAQIEDARRRDELEIRHTALAPGIPNGIFAEVEPSSLGNDSLFGHFAVDAPRDYRVRAQAWNGTSYTPIALDLLIRGGHQLRVHVEHWPDDRNEPQTKEIHFRFWPPLEGDDTSPWTCPCHRPAVETAVGVSHWELRVPITFKPPVKPIASWA